MVILGVWDWEICRYPSQLAPVIIWHKPSLKNCDYMTFHNNNYHTRRYRHPISYKNAKKGKSHRMRITLLRL